MGIRRQKSIVLREGCVRIEVHLIPNHLGLVTIMPRSTGGR